MKTSERISVILSIVNQSPGLGKTAIMKCLYLLQTLKKVPLGYDFEIYTYGPYNSTVMAEIDYANQLGFLNVEGIIYPNGQFGYNISLNEKGKERINTDQELATYTKEITEIASEFGAKSASELELLSTILFVHNMCKDKSKDNVCSIVNGIKTKYTITFINEMYDYMKNNNHLD